MPSKSKSKGYRVERKIVEMLKEEGFVASRVPLSGAAGSHSPDLRGDLVIDLGVMGNRWHCLRGEVKARRGGAGFAVLERWLGDNDLLFLHRDRQEPFVAMNWKTFIYLLREANADDY